MAASPALVKTHQHRWTTVTRKGKRPPKNIEGYSRFNLSKGRKLSSYEVEGAAYNPIEMNLPPGLPEVEWMSIGSKLVTVFESAAWWIGDWLLYGIETYGKKTAFDLAQQATGKKKNTLQTYACVCRKLGPELRVAGLSFDKHTYVCTLPPEKRKPVLEQAVELGLNDAQLRELVCEERGVVVPVSFRRRKIKDRMRVKIWLRGETFSQLQDMIGFKSVNQFIEELVTDFVTEKAFAQFREECKKQQGNVHGVDITDADVPF